MKHWQKKDKHQTLSSARWLSFLVQVLRSTKSGTYLWCRELRVICVLPRSLIVLRVEYVHGQLIWIIKLKVNGWSRVAMARCRGLHSGWGLNTLWSANRRLDWQAVEIFARADVYNFFSSFFVHPRVKIRKRIRQKSWRSLKTARLIFGSTGSLESHAIICPVQVEPNIPWVGRVDEERDTRLGEGRLRRDVSPTFLSHGASHRRRAENESATPHRRFRSLHSSLAV